MKTHFLRLLVIILALIYAPPLFATEPAKKKTKKDDRSVAVVEKIRDNRKRVALVIGNSTYLSSPLKNPVNDARAMAITLRRLGFEVDERINLGYISLHDAIENFGNKLKTGGVGLFYYAGHGMQVNGANYLIPVDAKINSENEVRYKAVDAGLVLAKMESAKSDVNIAILDACRDNPFARSFRSASRGLAQIDAPTGSIIAYATAPGKTAADGDGKNGIYTEALIKALESPGLKVEEVFKRVRKLVLDKTANAQVPWEASSLVGDFHFIPTSASTEQQPTVAQQQPVETHKQLSSRPMPADDGFEFEKEGFRFYKDVVVDTQTGLMWTRDKNVAGKYMNWNDAMNWAQNLNYSGYRDWRLPTKAELETFAKRSGYPPYKWANANGLKDIHSGGYWSSTSDTYDSVSAWGVTMYNIQANEVNKESNYRAWPVRSNNMPTSIPRPETYPNPVFTAPKRNTGFKDPTTGMEFVNVPEGCFTVNGKQVCLDAFSIGKYAVTQGQYKRIMGSNPSAFSSCGDNCPVEQVSWDDAQNFISKLNSKSGKSYRLPTEAEWEYACRSGGKNEKFCGGDNIDAVAWYSDNAGGKTHPVGQKQPNGLGIYDMSGNVWQWVQDWYGDNYPSNDRNPTGASSGFNRVVRGGGWLNEAGSVRAAYRYYLSPLRRLGLGFRLAASPVQ